MQIPTYIRTTSMVLCITIMLLGVIGNVMVPIVILKTKDMRNSTNIFLTNLSIADLLVLLVCTPTVLVEVNSRPETWVLGHDMCKAVPFVELTVAHASVLTILAISFERYYAICEPLKAGYVCTKARALMICLAAWVVAAVFTSPILLIANYRTIQYFDGTDVHVCLTQALDAWTVAYFLMTISLFFALPLIILIVLYTIIARHLISSDGAMLMMRPSKPEQSQRARRQVVFMLGAVVLSFFLCLLPFRVFTLLVILVSDEHWKAVSMENYYNVLYFCRVMLYLNSAVNPILYNLMSSKFRKGFRRVYCCCMGGWCGAWGEALAGDANGQRGTAGGGGGQHAANNGAATTSSFLTHSSCSAMTMTTRTGKGEATSSSCEQLGRQKTVSLDDLRRPGNSDLAGQQHHQMRPMVLGLQRTLSNETHSDADEFRKIALCNFGRQMRSLEVADVRGRQTSCDDGGGVSMAAAERRQLLFQYSLDESRVAVTAGGSGGVGGGGGETDSGGSDTGCSVPFLFDR